MRIAVMLGAALALGGCSLGAKAPPFLLTLNPATVPAANDGATIKSGDVITVGVPLAPQAIATTRIAVSSGSSAIAYVKDAVWVEPPHRLFQRLLAETIRARTGRTILDPRQFSMEPGTQLSGQLLRFDIDANAREAVAIYDATLSTSADKPVRTRRFEARQPLGEIDARQSGLALNKAANAIAAQVADWVAAS